MKISVVIPVRNESDNVETLVMEIDNALSAQEAYEMIFVDDGSTDGTSLKLQELMKNFADLRVYKHTQTCGQSRAIHTGVVFAQYPWIVTMDGDGQNNPDDIKKLIAIVEQDNDNRVWMVTGHRHERKDNIWRQFSSKFANLVRQAFLHDHTPDTGCGLKLFLRDKFLSLPYFDHIHRFIPAMMLMAGGEVVSVKVGHRPRKFGSSKYGTIDRLFAGIVDLLGVIWLKKRHSLPVIIEVPRGQ